MSRFDSIFSNFEGVFAGIAVPKHPLDDEQHAPFTAPTPAEIAAMRAGVEEGKRRNQAATPTQRLSTDHDGGSDL